MKAKNWLSSAVLAAALVCCGLVLAQAPTVRINPRYPALVEAQQHIDAAYAKLDAAQRQHRDHLGGHAEKAKQLLAEADQELAAASQYADQHR
ncbi:MAG TPA: hypothetical protein VMF66_06185 [Candidatus Acidoferrum sp.]|nr:hypothetical protein [Candidatus Acidoferrum sp.]